jgi:hypothetical protein
MESSAASIALNLLAFIGAGAYVLGQTNARGASAVDQRLGALFTVLMSLVGVRALRWWLEVEALRRVEETLAAVLPLFALFLAEGLLRRHAPAWLKKAIAIGAAIFMLAAVLRPTSLAPLFAYALGTFVSLALISLAVFLAARDRASLSAGENDAISALFVGLIIAVPLGATDFLAGAGVSPIRAGGLGLLVFILAVARVTAHGGGGLSVVEEVFWAALAAALSYIVFIFVFGAPPSFAALTLFALIAALVLTFRIVQYVRELREARSRSSFWRAFAEAPADDLDTFLDRMLDAPELQRAHLIEGAALAGYDQAALLRGFDRGPVLSIAEARAWGAGALEQLNVLFDEQEATHVILVTREPLRLLFVNLPRVGAGPDVDLQLQLLAKLAGQVARA